MHLFFFFNNLIDFDFIMNCLIGKRTWAEWKIRRSSFDCGWRDRNYRFLWSLAFLFEIFNVQGHWEKAWQLSSENSWCERREFHSVHSPRVQVEGNCSFQFEGRRLRCSFDPWENEANRQRTQSEFIRCSRFSEEFEFQDSHSRQSAVLVKLLREIRRQPASFSRVCMRASRNQQRCSDSAGITWNFLLSDLTSLKIYIFLETMHFSFFIICCYVVYVCFVEK